MSVDKKTLRRIFLGLAGLILLFWLLHETERVSVVYGFFKDMISPFVTGALLAFILNVPMRGIENRLRAVKKESLRRAFALTLTITLIILVLVLMFRLLLPQVVDTVGSLIEKVKTLMEEHPGLLDQIPGNAELKNIDWTSLVKDLTGYLGEGGISSIIGGAFEAIGNVYSGIFNGVIAVVFSIYCLARKEILARQARRIGYAFLPEKFCDKTIRILRLTNQTFSNFISGQCLEAVILGTLFAIAMNIFGMPYVPLISVLIGITALIPIVGAFIGCILGAFFILVDDPMQAVWFVAMFLIIQQIENNVIYPKVVGKSVGLPGMWVLVAVTVGGALMGVFGMLLMIPIVSVLFTLMREITTDRLEKRGIERDKLQAQPVEIRSRLQKKRKSSEAPSESDEDETEDA